MGKKYEFTGLEFKTPQKDVTVKQIRRISDGLIGGFIQGEWNLSHKGGCFVYGSAMVYGNAEIRGNAQIRGKSKVLDNAVVLDNAIISGTSLVINHALICDNAKVHSAIVKNNAYVGKKCHLLKGAIASIDPIYLELDNQEITISDLHIKMSCTQESPLFWSRTNPYLVKLFNYTGDIDNAVSLTNGLWKKYFKYELVRIGAII